MSDLLSHFDTQIQNQEQLLREREQELEELRRQRDRLATLTKKRDEILAELRVVENELALIEGTITGTLNRFASRPPTPELNPSPSPVLKLPSGVIAVPGAKSSLRDEIRKVLRAARGALSSPAIADRVRAGGYKTSNTDFPSVVKKALSEMDDVVQVRGRGYKLKQ